MTKKYPIGWHLLAIIIGVALMMLLLETITTPTPVMPVIEFVPIEHCYELQTDGTPLEIPCYEDIA